MEELLPFLEKNEVWIYCLLVAVAFIYFQKLITAWKDWQGTVFGLERESAQRRFSTALTIMVLSLLFVVVEFVIVSFVAPSYSQLAFLPTPTLDILATPTTTLPVALGAAAPQDDLTVPNEPQFPVGSAYPVGTANPEGTAPAGDTTASIPVQLTQEGCIPGQIEWTYPKPGESVTATIELKGTVNVPNLGYYKYEFSRPGEDLWLPIAVGNQAKNDGQIGFWNTSLLDQGDYFLRLVVADNEDNLFPACMIPVRVVNP